MKALASKTSCVILMCLVSTVHAEAQVIDPALDEQYLGDPDDILFWTPDQQVASYRNAQKIFPTRRVVAADNAFPLAEYPVELGGTGFGEADGATTVDEFFIKHKVAGMLVVKGEEIFYERYGLGNNKDSRWLSFSVAKSVTSMLIGAAIQDGYIESVNEKVSDYLPRLQGSAYDQVSIRNLLQMSSGVEWNEDYADPESDVNRSVNMPILDVYRLLASKRRVAPPGEGFIYNSSETDLAGNVLRAAIGNNLSVYLSEKIWKPFGMENDAYWILLEPGGGERGGCCINATLRDYARIGLFALRGGVLRDGTRVLPVGWMTESIAPSKGFAGYGYLWWPSHDGAYSALGIFGQTIYINPAADVVIALHSARATADNEEEWALAMEMFGAIVERLGD